MPPRHFRYTHTHFSESQTFTMSANFVGKYQRTSAEKYEEFLTALGVNFLLRKAATVSTPVMEVSEEGGNWTIKTSTTLKSMELKFKLDEEFRRDHSGRPRCQGGRQDGGQQARLHPDCQEGRRGEHQDREGIQRGRGRPDDGNRRRGRHLRPKVQEDVTLTLCRKA